MGRSGRCCPGRRAGRIRGWGGGAVERSHRTGRRTGAEEVPRLSPSPLSSHLLLALPYAHYHRLVFSMSWQWCKYDMTINVSARAFAYFVCRPLSSSRPLGHPIPEHVQPPRLLPLICAEAVTPACEYAAVAIELAGCHPATKLPPNAELSSVASPNTTLGREEAHARGMVMPMPISTALHRWRYRLAPGRTRR